MKEFLLNLFFPKFCLGCQKEGKYLCEDCFSLIDISNKILRVPELEGLFFATDFENFIVKKLIHNFKYKPFARELAKTLAFLIIIHFKNLEKSPEFLNKKEEFVLIPIPLHKRRLRWRGFNQAKEIAKELSVFLKIPVLDDILIKEKETHPQVNLSEKERKENIKGAFIVKNEEKIKRKKVLLVDDVFTTGATMEEATKVLKKSGAKEIWGIVVAKE